MRQITPVSVQIIRSLKESVGPKHRAVCRVFWLGVFCCRQMTSPTAFDPPTPTLSPCPGSQSHLKDSKSDFVFL